jgi:hypothetical protein
MANFRTISCNFILSILHKISASKPESERKICSEGFAQNGVMRAFELQPDVEAFGQAVFQFGHEQETCILNVLRIVLIFTPLQIPYKVALAGVGIPTQCLLLARLALMRNSPALFL